MPSRELAIIGCGGHGITVLDVVLDSNPEADIIFLDENAKSGETIVTKNPPRVFEVAKKMVGESAKEYFVAIGDNQKRKSISHSLGKTAFATIIAKDALIGMDAQIESGSFIGHQAIVGPLAWVGEGTIINTRSHISHEVRVGRYSQLALDVTVGGRTEIGDEVFIGMKASIFDRLKICSEVSIGASSVVTEDIEKPGVYIGTPAKLVK